MYGLVLVFGTVLLVGAFAFGVALGRRGGRAAALGCAVGVAIIALRVAGRFHPQYEFQWLDPDVYSYLRPWWVMPAGTMVFGIAVFRVRSAALRVAAEGVAGFVLVFFCLSMYATATLDPARFTGTIDEEGNCLQTSPFSCGAAAAATFLHRLGVPATEREMVRLCGTNYLTGTDEFAAARGIRAKRGNRPWRIRLKKGGVELLRSENLPVMATVRHSFRVDHWVVATRREGDVLRIADPSRGVREESIERFLERWRGVVLCAEERGRRPEEPSGDPFSK